MARDLQKMKDLRERGATVQMQEDLASFLDDGYDSDLFLPTIDFILMLQNKAQSQSVEQENTLDLSDFDIPEVYDPGFFNKISIKASAELVKSAAIEERLKLELLAYLDSMDIQKNVGKGSEEAPESRAHISNSRKRDRKTGNVKSVFESVVSGLNALQVRLSKQGNTNKKQQEKASLQSRISNLIQQRLMRSDIELHDDSPHDHKTAKKERKFLKSMRKAFIGDNKNDAASGTNDSQQNRSGGNDKEQHEEGKAVSDVAHKYEQAQEQASKSAGEYKKSEQKKDAQITASKSIAETKEIEKSSKEASENKPEENKKTQQRLRNTKLQSRLNQTRISRQQRQRDNAIHQEEQAHTRHEHGHDKINDKVAAKAVNQLKSMGVSLSEAEVAKVSNKELSNVAKLQDKQRGG